ncbi:hypothetical protein M406DRAFT_70784 [Cryphonectria parasitica EP155]|uniref:Uncharacterized protein n=1 Tax=Cryphonectria parasitica (strain ATCC 38755 / EP155) TaxID=660469 RepID=A0A9P4Y0F4_CRYP1|nr:uncharacterized protein M406DRAFT_70784 [Cryphonectria parasitica EP155]KAF3764692.1 hypothetical protein M406DRAFT_70784 [Cryphonectria parasitica EP155]
MTALQTFDYFFDLPGELREQILSYLLVRSHGVGLGSMPGIVPSKADDIETGDFYDCPKQNGAPAYPLNYFLVSQTFHDEATSVYFRENSFHIVATGRKYLPTQSGLVRVPDQVLEERTRRAFLPSPGEALLNRPDWAHVRQRIRKVVLYLQRPRGFLEKEIFEPLLDMILAGGLKSLDVRICWFGSRGQKLLSCPPLKSLYRVLGDPDLDDVRLRVAARAHEQVWCPFHDGGGDGYKRCRAEKVEKHGKIGGLTF